jgi:nucleotide-binding universal stress UspA family protein
MNMQRASAIPWFGRLPAILARIFVDRAPEATPPAMGGGAANAAHSCDGNAAGGGGARELPEVTPGSREDILVPLDFSRESLAAADYAINVARRSSARVILLHAIHLNLTPYGPANPAWLRAALCREALGKMEQTMVRAREAGVPVISVIEEGAPAKVIVRVAGRWKTDLIVLAAEKRRKWSRFFGQHIREKLQRGASCPIVVLEVETEKETA